MSDEITALQRSIELLASEMRDLNRWLRIEQGPRFTRIEEEQALQRTIQGEHSEQMADVKVDQHSQRLRLDEHDHRIAALEAAVKKG